MITKRKASDIPGRVRLFIVFLDRPHNQITSRMKVKHFWRWDYPLKTSARDFCFAILINNVHWTWITESAKALYGSYENFNGDVPIKNVDVIFSETIKHVNKEQIGAFYRAAYGKFVTVLKEAELKDLYSHEINLGRVGDTDHV